MSAADVADELKREREYERLLLDAAEQALDWPVGQRAARLAEYYGADETTLARIHDLLSIAEADRRPPSDQPLPEGPTTDADPPPPRIGPYRIGELLGRGSLGRVFRAEYSDGAFTRPVALQLVRRGFATEALEAQFAREIEQVASLRHPQIARLLDGGVSAEGQAYVVSELLQGTPITEYAAGKALTPRATVELFLPACEAVAHAHARLFVHADLEPRNVVVIDGKLRLLDFGVARMLESATPTGTASAPASSPGIAAVHASPARRRGEPVTTLDDVYSLGALLEELLARCPEVPPDLRAVAARARTDDPAARHPTVDALREELRRWLDGHAVQAYPGGWRYAARKWLAQHRVAGGIGALALLLLVGAAAAGVVLAVRGDDAPGQAGQRPGDGRVLATDLLFDVHDRLERMPRTRSLRRDLAAEAQRDLDRLAADADAVPELRLAIAEGLRRLAALQGASGGTRLGEGAAARRNLARAIAITDGIADTRALRDERALTAVRLALLDAALAQSVELDLEAADAALARARDRLDTLRARGATGPDTQALERAWALEQATLLRRQGRYRESRDVATAALAQRLDTTAPDPRQDRTLQRARLLEVLAGSRLDGGQPAESLAPYRERLQLLETAARANPDDVALGRQLAHAGQSLGSALLALDRAAEAEPLLAQSRARFEQLLLLEPDDRDLPPEHDVAAHAHGQALARLRRFREAEPILRLSIAHRSARLDAEPSDARLRRDLAIARTSLGDVLVEQGQRRDACAIYAQAAMDVERIRVSGKLAALDEDVSVRRLRAQQARHCPR